MIFHHNHHYEKSEMFSFKRLIRQRILYTPKAKSYYNNFITHIQRLQTLLSISETRKKWTFINVYNYNQFILHIHLTIWNGIINFLRNFYIFFYIKKCLHNFTFSNYVAQILLYRRKTIYLSNCIMDPLMKYFKLFFIMLMKKSFEDKIIIIIKVINQIKFKPSINMPTILFVRFMWF